MEIQDEYVRAALEVHLKTIDKCDARNRKVRLTDRNLDDHTRTVNNCIDGNNLHSVQDLAAKYEREDMKKIVTHTVDGKTPLLEAAKNTSPFCVNGLLKKYHAEVDQRAVHELNDGTKHECTALWVAAAHNRPNVVRALLRHHKADINSMSSTGYTPLMVACIADSVQAANALIENGADVNITGPDRINCVMASVYSSSLCRRLLLQKKIDIDGQDRDGDTALHYAIMERQADTVKVLLKFGANPRIQNLQGNCSVRQAAIFRCSDILDFLFAKHKICREKYIDAIELLASSYAIRLREHTAAYNRFCKAMKLRFEDPKHIVEKPENSHEKEIRTLSEFEAIANDRLAISEQAHLVCSRVLEPAHPFLLDSLIFLAEMNVYKEQWRPAFDACIKVFDIMLEHNAPLSSHFMKALELVYKILCTNKAQIEAHSIGTLPQFDEINKLLGLITSILCRDTSHHQTEEDVAAVLHLIHFLTTVPHNPGQDLILGQTIFRLNKSVRLPDGRSLLHLAADKRTSRFDSSSLFPSPSVVQMLIQCGSDVNAMDNVGNSPLFFAVPKCLIPIEEEKRCVSVCKYLLRNGAHIDVVNQDGVVLSKKLTKAIPKIKSFFSLKLWALRAIKKHNIAVYEELFPQLK